MKLDIIFATGNRNKIREIEEIITDPGIHVRSMKQAGIAADPEESGQSFEDNALIKATAVAKNFHQNESVRLSKDIPVVIMSDDSGLCIDALNGEPGIHSARFMGHDTDYTVKMNAILEKLSDVPDEKRTARFTAAVCAVLVDENDSHIVLTRSMEGCIAHEIRGVNGFGYDPFFYLPEYGKTSAEIPPEEKNAISHRGKALRAVLSALEEHYSGY